MKFALFFLGEYAAMIIGSALIVTLFLGGWSHRLRLDATIGSAPPMPAAFCVGRPHPHRLSSSPKWSPSSSSSSGSAGRVPRFRYDQLMSLGWVVFFEIALVNVFLAAADPACW